MRILSVTISTFVWVAGCLLPPPAAASIDRGKAIFRQLCASCHGAQGEGNRLVGAPALAGLPSWYVSSQLEKFASGVRGKDHRDSAGLKMYPIARMLRKDDVGAVADVVGALPRAKLKPTVAGNPTAGQTRFAACAACHGAGGEGKQELKAPPLAGMSDWYLLRQLRAFNDGLRAADPAADPTGAAMVPMARSLGGAPAMADVVSFLAGLETK